MSALNGCAFQPLTEWGHHPHYILISFVFYNLHLYKSGHQPVVLPAIGRLRVVQQPFVVLDECNPI